MKQKPIPCHLIAPPAAPLKILATSSASISEDDEKYTYSMDDKFTLPTLKDSSSSGQSKSESRSKSAFASASASASSATNFNDGLCLDQKKFFSHLAPRPLILSTLRTSILQASNILTSYFTEQLAYETSLEEQMMEGKITPLQLEVLNTQWEGEEWTRRWKTFPDLLKRGLVKYHVLVLVMRTYEKLFGLVLTREMMDRLTKDPFKYAKETSPSSSSSRAISGPSVKDEKYQDTATSTCSSDVAVTNSKKSYSSDMFQTCFYSSIVSFLADYTIQQTILCYGYYTFIKNNKREKRLQMLKDLDLKQEHKEQEEIFGDEAREELLHSSLEDDLVKAPSDSDANFQTDDQTDEDNEDVAIVPDNGSWNNSNGGLLLSFTYKSSKLLVARSIGLFVAAVGGAIGSKLRPGWGTLFGIQLGDSCVGALLDE